MNIEVHSQILQQLPKEHIEAVVDDVMQIWRSFQDRHDTLIAINPRRIAVILDKQANRGAVLPVQLIEHVIDASTRTELMTWLETLPSRFFVRHRPGSWFMPYDTESKKSKIVEPGFMRTNMTYDPGEDRQNSTAVVGTQVDVRAQPKGLVLAARDGDHAYMVRLS